MYLLYTLLMALLKGNPFKKPTLTALSDEDLMLRFQRGDERAFEALMRRLERPLSIYITRLSPEQSLTQDLLQETFLRVARNADRYTPTAKVSSWVYTIARNLCIDAYRKRRGQRLVSLDQEMSAEGDGFTLHHVIADDDLEAQPDVHTEQGLFFEALTAALEKLNPDQREVFMLREVQGFKFQEIAELMGETESTIKSRMRYALQGLQRHLPSYRPVHTRGKEEA
jgi:RNA polymerase sigma-70 factor, ECF subfamily